MRVLSVDSNCKCISNCKRDNLEALRGYWKGIKSKKQSFLPNELKEYFVTRVKPQHVKEKVNYLNVDMNKIEKHAVRKPIERHIYVEVKKSAKEIQTQTTADIQDYYTVLRTIVAEINPNPSHESVNENASEIGIKSEPELNLSIAHDTNSFGYHPETTEEFDLLNDAHSFKKTRWIYEAHQRQIKSIRQNILQII